MAQGTDDRRLQAIQNEVLEMIAYGDAPEAVAATLCRRIEEFAPEAICSVLTVDELGRLHPLASPSLPECYSQELDGIRIGPGVGSCGTAVHRGEPVLVEDIATDPLWEDYRWLAVPQGLRACWSSPIKARGGRVIGTFGLYFRTPRGPNAQERLAVDTCVHLCAIAIEQHEIRSKNHQLAYYDTLTGLPNRFHADLLMQRGAEASAERLGLLLVDIDDLKVTNDTLGHAVGDALIRQVARRIADGAHPGVACRIGGDEFVVILGDCSESSCLAAIAQRILDAMEAPFHYEGHMITPHVTIGGVIQGRGGTSLDTFRQNADLALYHSKERGRGGFVEFTESLRTTMMMRTQRIREVEAALSSGRIVAHYQPVVELATGKILGAEALARLVTDEGTLLPAYMFQEALTDPSVARRLTDVMLGQAAASARAWLDLGIPFRHVGINVTTADFRGGDLERRIAAAFGAVDVPLRYAILEVTETVLVGGSDRRVADAVSALRGQGLSIALDDFGTGYASLTHLLTLPVDCLKIDKGFVERLTLDEGADVIVGAMVDIGRRLGMRVIAEGVETEAQLARLRELGCGIGQGYHFYRPAAFDETTRRLLMSAGLGRGEAAEQPERRRHVA